MSDGSISLSKAVRSNLLSLQNTASLMSQTQERLATGNKVNSALDNPTNFFTASSLNSRASDMNALMDGMSNGIQTLEAADNGLSAITKNIESMQSTLRQARQDKTFQTESLDMSTLTGTAAAATNLTLSGGAFATGVTGKVALTKDDAAVPASLSGAVDAKSYADVAPTAATYLASTDTAGAAIGADIAAIQGTFDGTAHSFDLTFNGVTKTISTTTDTTDDADVATAADHVVSDLQSAINTAFGAGKVAVSTTSAGVLTLAEKHGTGSALTVEDGTSGAAADFGFTDGDTNTGAVDDAAVDKTFTIDDGTDTTTITLKSSDSATLDDAIKTINKQLADNGVTDVTAKKDADGKLTLVGGADGKNDVTVAGTDVADFFGTTLTDAGAEAGATQSYKTVDELVNSINNDDTLSSAVRASNDNGKLRIQNLSTQDLDIDGADSTGKVDGTSTGANSIGGNKIRSDFADQFNDLRDQLDKLSDDASFNGINLLRGDKLTITFNETGTSSIDIQAKDKAGAATSISSLNLGIDSLDAADLDSDDNIDKLLSGLSSALNTIRSQSSSFGSNLSSVQNRQDFTKNMVNTLQTGAANLTLADTNEEGANLLALQTRQQLSTTALSMASQSDQAVLRLF
ncbi:MAG TPA: flagellin [Devosiaceae bacterium]|jgi:flagellin-like hook-associated protein FlgL